MKQKQQFWIALTIMLSCLGIALILYQTQLYPGVGGDSVHYVMGAENILSGKGYARLSGGGEVRPITGFPPLYSIVLAGVGLTKVDLFEGARILNAALFGVSIFLTSKLLFAYTRSIMTSLIGGALVLTSLSLVNIYSMVMTEPLFIFLMLLAILTLVRYLDTQKVAYLILSGIMVSLSVMTRYVGLSLLGAGGLSILFFSRTHWKRRILDCILFAGLTVFPLYLWLQRNASVEGTAVNRELIYHPMSATLMRAFIAEVLSWFVPRILGLSRGLRNLLVIILTIPWMGFYYFQEIMRFFKQKSVSRKDYWSLPWVLTLYAGIYLVILILNSTLLDAGTTMSAPPRYLAPVFVAIVLIFVLAIHQLIEPENRGRLLRGVVLLLGIAVVAVHAKQVFDYIQDPFSAGGYFEYKVKRAEAVPAFEALDPEVPIISNNPEMVYVMSGRSAYMWPIQFDVYKLEDRVDFEDQLKATREKLFEGGVLVVFGWPEGAETLVDELLEAERLAHFIDVSFWGYPEASRD
jgi:hypothetical protein